MAKKEGKGASLGGRHHGGHQSGMGHKGFGKKVNGMSASMGKKGSADIEGPHEKDMAHK